MDEPEDNILSVLKRDNESRRKNPMYRLWVYRDDQHPSDYFIKALGGIGFCEHFAACIHAEATAKGRANLGSFTKADLAAKKKILALKHMRHTSESEFL